jgi:hypothetical protein
MKVTRRWVLGCGVGALFAVALGSAALPFIAAWRRLMIQRLIYYYVPGVTFDGDDLTEFAAYIHRNVLWRDALGIKRLVYYGSTFLLYHSALRNLVPARGRVSSIDREIINRFFLCTDFWDAPHTAGRRIALVRSPDPYEAGCSNPLADTALNSR